MNRFVLRNLDDPDESLDVTYIGHDLTSMQVQITLTNVRFCLRYDKQNDALVGTVGGKRFYYEREPRLVKDVES